MDSTNGGIYGEILRINLTKKTIRTENTEKYSKKWLGGRAIASWILLDETYPKTKWSDEDNPLIFSPGCLVGTSVPGACRVSIDTINAFNNGKGSANFGGHWGPELKKAGFDHIVIVGKSQSPVYICIRDGNVEIRDADFIWGKMTDETERLVQKELADDTVRVVSIGPAGENLVRGAAIVGDCGQVAGGSGVGCVMGNKKLKAIAVRGEGAVKLAQPQRYNELAKGILSRIENAPVIKDGGRLGIIVAQKYGEKESIRAPVRNGQDEYFPLERMRKLVGVETGVPRYQTKMVSCSNCPVGCQPFYKIDKGTYKGLMGFTYWANSMGYSIRMDSDDPATSLKYQLMCNQLGLDGDNTIVAISWAFECYEKGLLSKSDTGGLALDWGNDEAWIALTEKIARREGLGDLLANGVYEASSELGKGSEKLATHCKRQGSFEGFRGFRLGWGLGVATSPVAGRHLRGASGWDTLAPISKVNITEQAEAVFRQLINQEIDDIIGVCISISSASGEHEIGSPHFSHLIHTAFGLQLTVDELIGMALASYNLEKAFNTIHTNFSREDDYPPERYTTEPISTGPLAGKKIDMNEYRQILDKFYTLLGWDVKTSLQTPKCLEHLGMKEVIQKLYQYGKL